MNIAAFDLGTRSAVAWKPRYGEGRVLWQQWDLVDPKGKPLVRDDRFARWGEALKEWFSIWRQNLDGIVYERPFVRGQAATRSLWGMAGILAEHAVGSGLFVLDVTPAEIKKEMTGSGKASKGNMIAEAALLGYTGASEHEADAYCLYHFGTRKISNAGK